MKRIVPTLLLVILTCSISAHGQSTFIADGLRYRIVKEADASTTFGRVYVTSPNDRCTYTGNIVIPNAVKETDGVHADSYKVIGIDSNAFEGLYDIHSIELSPSIEFIGEYAFKSCHDLKTVKIPLGNLKKIGENAFALSEIEEIVIPTCVMSIGPCAFNYCSKLERVVLSEGLKKIDRCVFMGCTSLARIDLPNTLERLEMATFMGSGISHLDIPGRITIIPDSLCDQCGNLESVTMGESVSEIGIGAFRNCPIKQVKLPSKLKIIKEGAFAGTKLTSIDLPQGLRYLGPYCFNGSLITSIVFPDGIKDITGCVADCSLLEEITLPKGITRLGDYAFKGTRIAHFVIPDGITEIGESCFEECEMLTSVSIPQSVTKIGRSAFAYCSSLKEVSISDGIKEIPEGCFLSANALTSIRLPKKLESIGASAFWRCRNLADVVFPPTLKSIGENAFLWTKVKMPTSLTEP